MKYRKHLLLLALYFGFVADAPSAEKRGWLDLKSARSAYQNPDVRSELVDFSVYLLEVVAELSSLKAVVRITVTGEWGKSRSFMIYQNDNGFAVQKVQRIIEPYGLEITSCSINEEQFEVIVSSFDEFRKKLALVNERIDSGRTRLESFTPLILLEKISSNGVYTGALMSPSSLGSAGQALDDAILNIGIACPSEKGTGNRPSNP